MKDPDKSYGYPYRRFAAQQNAASTAVPPSDFGQQDVIHPDPVPVDAGLLDWDVKITARASVLVFWIAMILLGGSIGWLLAQFA